MQAQWIKFSHCLLDPFQPEQSFKFWLMTAPCKLPFFFSRTEIDCSDYCHAKILTMRKVALSLVKKRSHCI